MILAYVIVLGLSNSLFSDPAVLVARDSGSFDKYTRYATAVALVLAQALGF